MASTSISPEVESAYGRLGLQTSCSREQVKEAFRRLCLQYHPDKCAPELRPTAETTFREIKTAYDTILRGQAGYAPPPPGTQASRAYAEAYYRAHGMDYSAGPFKVGGPYGGYTSEMDFYRSMFRVTRNNPFAIIMAGLLAIPAIAMATKVLNGDTGFIEKFKKEGIHGWTRNRFKVNGRETLNNPFSIGTLSNREESYIYKTDKFKHLRQSQPPAGQDGASPAGA